MTVTNWTESFATIDPNVWVSNNVANAPTALGAGKIKFQKTAPGSSCQLTRVPFGAQGTLAAQSVCVAHTVYPGESSLDWFFASGNMLGLWPSFNPHSDEWGFTFIDQVQRYFYNNRSGYPNSGIIQEPQVPFEVRVSVFVDPATNLTYNTMAIDGVIVREDVSTSWPVSWETTRGYSALGFVLDVNDTVQNVVIGNVYGIYGGTRDENKAWVESSLSSTMAPVPTLNGANLSLDSLAELPILYSRNLSSIPRHIPSNTTVSSLTATLYTAPFTVADGETIYMATVVGNGYDPATEDSNWGYSLTAPKAYAVSLPKPPSPTIHLSSGSYAGIQYATVTSPSGTIYYTLDGSDPTTSSTVYTRPIKIMASEQLRAIAVVNGVASVVVSMDYTITRTTPVPIASYRDALLPLLLEQYKGDNP